LGGILISHCEQDRVAAEHLRSRLAGLTVPQVADFVSLTTAVSEKPLRAEMSAARALVVLLSAGARQDSKLVAESGVAAALARPVIAVLLGEARQQDFDFMEASGWIQAGKGEDADRLAHRIHRALRDLLK
jgi:hypothetical protein